MKKALLTTVILIISSMSQSQYSAIRLGVLPFYDAETGNIHGRKSKLILSELINSLSEFKFIKLLERSKLKELTGEIELSQTGLIDEATAVKAGKVHGLQIIIVGTINRDKITSRAIHMETQKIISSTSTKGINNIRSLADRLASGIETYLARENIKRLRNDSSLITLKFWAESQGRTITENRKGELKIGEKVVFRFKANTDGYLTIVDIQPGGDVVILFPNDLRPSNRIRSGRIYSIPSKDDGFEITVSKPAGTDTLIAFFTEKKVDWLDRKKLTGEGFWSVKKNHKIAMSRGFEITATKLKKTEWESKLIEINVKE